MGVLDDASQYYAEPRADWSLGDLVVVPTGIFRAVTERRIDPYPQPMPPADGTRSVAYHLWLPRAPAPPLPSPIIEAWLTPAMIVVDDCVLDEVVSRTWRSLIGSARIKVCKRLARWRGVRAV